MSTDPEPLLLGCSGAFIEWAQLIESSAIRDSTQSSAPLPSQEVGAGLKMLTFESHGWLPWQPIFPTIMSSSQRSGNQGAESSFCCVCVPQLYISSWGALARRLSWVEHHLLHQKVVGSVPVGANVRDNWSMFLSHINVSLPLLLPPFPCLRKPKKSKN